MIKIDESFLFDSLRKMYAILSYCTPNNYMFPPIRYFLELTYRCNLSCPYCFINENRVKDEMTTQEWFNIIEQIPFYSFISIVAGEVLLREDFFSILEKASKQNGGKISLITNGVLLNKEFLEQFIKNNMLLLSVSLDGYKENHDNYRNKKGLYSQVINNLELLNELKKKHKKKRPLIDIKSVILENNLSDLPKLYKEATNLNADFYSLSFKRNNYLRQNSKQADTFGEEFCKKEYPLEMYFDKEEFIEVYRELESISRTSKTKLRWAPKFKPTNDLERILKYFELGNTPVKDIYKPCYLPFSTIFITPDGNTYPCLSYKTGNVRGENIQKVLNNERNREFRRLMKNQKIFNACQMCCDSYLDF